MRHRQIPSLVKRSMRARSLGLRFIRSRSFRPPGTILVDGNRTALHLPDDVSTRNIFLEILISDCYRLDNVPRPVTSVLDIGANVGIFCIAARNIFPHAVIHAYEPNPRLEPYLRHQAAISRCNYFMEAVGLDDGSVLLDLKEHSAWTRSRRVKTGAIPCIGFRTTIDRLGGTVDFAKIDCEGAEWEFLSDYDAWNRVRTVAMEYHLWPDHSHDEILKAITELGFVVTHHEPAHDFGLIFGSREMTPEASPRSSTSRASPS